MKEINIKSWDHFEDEVEKSKSWVEKLEKKNNKSLVSQPIFRGQSNPQKKLESTLDRVRKNVSLREYHEIILDIRDDVVSEAKKPWDIREYSPPRNLIFPFFNDELTYHYMAYLRHHGFPSPLLDWSRDEYIALHFALSDIYSDEDMVLFVFIEDIGEGKTLIGDGPIIRQLPSIQNFTKRHAQQQSEYTICVCEKDDEFFYGQHQRVIDQEVEGQDVLQKLIIPFSLRETFLKKVHDKNITSFFTLGGEDGLVHFKAEEKFILNFTKVKTD